MFWHLAPEKHYVRAHEVAPLAACGGGGFEVLHVEGFDIVGVADGAYFHKFTMEVEHF